MLGGSFKCTIVTKTPSYVKQKRETWKSNKLPCQTIATNGSKTIEHAFQNLQDLILTWRITSWFEFFYEYQ